MSFLPQNWDIVPFSRLATYKVGKTPSRANDAFWKQSSATIPWVSIADMRPYADVVHTKEKITLEAFQTVFRGQIVPKGTLLMSFKLSIGRIAYLSQDACHNEAIISIHPNKEVNTRFLAYFLSYFDYSELYDRQIKGNTLNKEKIDRIPVVCPPPKEQDSIAAVLDLIRKGITIAEKKQTLLMGLKHATMHKLFTCGLRNEPQKETEIGLMPKSWEPTTIGDFALKAQYGLSLRGNNKGKYPILRMNCQVDGKVEFKDLQYVDIDNDAFLSFKLYHRDILFNRTNSIEHVGRTAIYNHHDDAVFASYLVRVSVDAEKCIPEFLNYYMNWPTTQWEIKKLASRAVGQANINATKLRTVKVPLPETIEEQQEIVDVLDAIDRKIDLHRRKKAVLEELFKSLLHKLMTGEVRVDDLDLSALEAMQPQAQGGAV